MNRLTHAITLFLTGLICSVLITSCGSQGNFAASFGKRKYTKGYYWDGAGDKPIAASTTKTDKPGRVEESGECIDLKTITANHISSSIKTEISLKKLSPGITPLGKSIESLKQVNITSKPANDIINKEAQVSYTDPQSTFKDILIWICVIIGLLGLISFICGLVSLFSPVFTGISATLLILGGLGIVVIFFIFALLLAMSEVVC